MIKLIAKRELFVQGYISGKTATQAYIDAGYSEQGAGPNSGRLIKNDKIVLRIAEIQEELRGQTMITLQSMVEEFIKDRTSARQQKNVSASIKANVELAKLNGLYELDNIQKLIDSKSTPELLERSQELRLLLQKPPEQITQQN